MPPIAVEINLQKMGFKLSSEFVVESYVSLQTTRFF